MNCPACGQENAAGRKFCRECGAHLEPLCSACGLANDPGDKFCGNCGAPVGAAAAGRSARFAAPTEYTPPHLADRILASRDDFAEERKQVTVLFADLTSSTELIAGRDPEQARAVLDPVLELMIDAVHRYEGMVNQVLGDGIMALFGAPIAHEDHSVRACYAALAMQATVKAHAAHLLKSAGVPVQIRVGLNSGEVVTRSIGSDLRMEYTAVGQTTHLAARMEQMAHPGSIFITSQTAQLSAGSIQSEPLGPFPVKGMSAPVEVFELTGTTVPHARFQGGAIQRTAFVGREREERSLEEALSWAASGQGQVVAVVGEAGVGKSRLAWEFAQASRTRGWLVLESRSTSYGHLAPYLALTEMLRAYFAVAAQDDADRVREKVQGKLLDLDRGLRSSLPALLQLLNVPIDEPTWNQLDPAGRRQRTHEAVKNLFLRESRVHALLLTFDDIHWIDSETRAVLDHLVESLPAARVLLLVNYRPEYRHGWGNKTYYTQLRLDPLPRASADLFLGTLLGSDPSLDALKALLAEWTEGNPFFLEESVQSLRETGVLVGDQGHCQLVKPVGNIPVPATVQAVLAARIDRLPAEAKRLLQSAAVIGKEVPFPLLAAISSVPEDRFRPWLAHLQATEFLYEADLFPQLKYSFKHPLTHDVAYGSLLGDRRRALHAQIMEAIERTYPDQLGEQVEALAHHAFLGERWTEAAGYLREAGEKADSRSALHEAVAYYEQALEALGRLPETREKTTQALDIRLALRQALYPLGEMPRLIGHLREAERLAGALGDESRTGWASIYISNYLQISGEYDEALIYARRALDLAMQTGDAPLTFESFHRLGLTYYARGDAVEAKEFLEKAVGAVALVGDHARFGFHGLPSVMARQSLAHCLADCGDFGQATQIADEATRIAEGVEHIFTKVAGCAALGTVYVLRGEVQYAIPLLERGVDLCRTWHIPFQLPVITALLGHAYPLAGRAEDAVRLLEESVERGQVIGFTSHQARRLVLLAQAHLAAANCLRAGELAGEALTLARSVGEKAIEADSRYILGEVAAHQEPPDFQTAQDHLLEALAAAERLGLKPLAAHCHSGLSHLSALLGDHKASAERQAAALDLYRAMGMRYWVDRVQDEIAAAAVEAAIPGTRPRAGTA